MLSEDSSEVGSDANVMRIGAERLLVSSQDNPPQGPNCFPGIIDRAIYIGITIQYFIRLGNNELVKAICPSSGDTLLELERSLGDLSARRLPATARCMMTRAFSLPKTLISWLRKRPKLQGLVLAGPAGIYLTLFMGIPLLMVLLYSFWTYVPGEPVQRIFTLENYAHFFTQPIYTRILLRSFLVGAETALLALVIAYPTAYYLANRNTSSSTLNF